MKYTKEIIENIVLLISTDEYTIQEICDIVDISKETYYCWMKEHSDFSDAVKNANVARLEYFKKAARKSLAKKLVGYDYEETVTVYVSAKGKEAVPVIKEQRVTKKHMIPDTTAIIFTLKNTDQEYFKDKHEVDISEMVVNLVIDSDDAKA